MQKENCFLAEYMLCWKPCPKLPWRSGPDDGLHVFLCIFWIILKPCTLVVDILKICMQIFVDEKIIFDKITAFST